MHRLLSDALHPANLLGGLNWSRYRPQGPAVSGWTWLIFGRH
jgi:hypothetical protein